MCTHGKMQNASPFAKSFISCSVLLILLPMRLNPIPTIVDLDAIDRGYSDDYYATLHRT
jgi:hypothetical protein